MIPSAIVIPGCRKGGEAGIQTASKQVQQHGFRVRANARPGMTMREWAMREWTTRQ